MNWISDLFGNKQDVSCPNCKLKLSGYELANGICGACNKPMMQDSPITFVRCGEVPDCDCNANSGCKKYNQ